MNQYKKVFLSLQILSFIIIFITLFLIVFPIYQNYSKPWAEVTVSFLTKNSDNFKWFKSHEKILESNTGKEQLLFADEQILDQQVLENIYHKSIVLEHLFHTISEDDYKIKQLSALTGISYTGYSGKTYQDLSSSDEVPGQIISQYESSTGKKWSYVGEGIIISSLDNIIVLQKGLDYKGNMTLSTDSSKLTYIGDFEITSGSLGTKPSAYFDLKVTSAGEKLLNQYGLVASFPAYYVMNSPLYNLYYFTGDYSAYQPDVPAMHELLPIIMRNKLLYSKQNNEKVYWKWYYPQLTKIMQSTKSEELFVARNSLSDSQFYVQNKKIYLKNNDSENKKLEDKEFFIKGVNLGAALPGKTFTEFPQDKEIYLDWLEKMATMNVNTIRIYTLFPPAFYEALYEFNTNNTEPIYLFQEIWPEENPKDSNYLDTKYNVEYQTEIKYVVDAIHGNANITLRQFRAYGLYRFDVSKYLLGYLVGREMEPEEVIETDTLNHGYTYDGEYIYSESLASPTESWLAASCDYVLQVEESYHSRPMVGIVSWPTLDSLTHDSEWNITGDKDLQYNDKAVVDIDHIAVNPEKVTGFFGAYHIYPNYPDFMNNDAKYANYSDDLGEFRYGGYLQDFMEQNTKYPAIVAEYGMSTSMYTAHYNPDGYDHGGVSEEKQADGIIRMTKAIIEEGYAGAIIFEWMDEWTKKTWTTEPYMIPYERNQFWHNVLDPEQNYGLIAYRSNQNLNDGLTTVYQDEAVGEEYAIKTVMAGQDESYLYLNLNFTDNVSANQPFTIEIKTDSEKTGVDYSEFIIKYNQTPEILVNPGYNWTKGMFRAQNDETSLYEEMIQLTNNENTDKNGNYTPAKSQNLSKLAVGSFEIPQNQIQIENNQVIFRLPYGILGISDPSSRCILSDSIMGVPGNRDAIATNEIDKIKYVITLDEKKYTFEQTLSSWEAPKVIGVPKKSFQNIGTFFGQIE